ncbi:MAG: phospholipid carrier-dependent glycosyltransferase, partial [Candidatus Latescibacterota bacterium]
MKRFAGGPLFIAIVISGAALAWRLCGIGWGFPDVYEEATSVRKAWGFWGWDGKPFDFNPHFFNYPSFHFYLQFGVQAIVRLFGKLSGRVPDEAAFRAAYYLKPALFVGAGRFLTALLGSLSVFFLYWTGRRLGGARVAVPAALFLALHAVHVEKSRYVEVDVAMTFFVVLSTFYLAGAASGPARRGLFPGSAAIGLAAATKYPGALFLLHVPMAAWLAGRPDPRRVLLALLLAASVFAAASPYVLLDRSAFLRDFGAESVHMQEGHFGGGGGGPLG